VPFLLPEATGEGSYLYATYGVRCTSELSDRPSLNSETVRPHSRCARQGLSANENEICCLHVNRTAATHRKREINALNQDVLLARLLECAMSNIATVVHAFEVNFSERLVGPR